MINKDGKVWLGENLRYKTNAAEAYDNHEINVFPFGYNYSHEEAVTALPEGFRLPNSDEWNEICLEIPIINGPRHSRVSSTKGISSINLLEAGWIFDARSSWMGVNGYWWCEQSSAYVSLSRVSAKQLKVVNEQTGFLPKVKMPVRCLMDE